MNPEDEAEEDGANIDLDSQRKGKCVVLKTSTRQVSQLSNVLYILFYLTSKANECVYLYHLFLYFNSILILWYVLIIILDALFTSWIWVFALLQTIFLPVVGLVDPDKLKPGDLVGVNKDSYLILDTLPSEYDSRVKAMEVDEKPTEDYNDIGGLEKQASFQILGMLCWVPNILLLYPNLFLL